MGMAEGDGTREGAPTLAPPELDAVSTVALPVALTLVLLLAVDVDDGVELPELDAVTVALPVALTLVLPVAVTEVEVVAVSVVLPVAVWLALTVEVAVAEVHASEPGPLVVPVGHSNGVPDEEPGGQ
jgi:hypothetical protein